MPRTTLIEPVVMLLTILQWIVLATLTGIIVGTGTSLYPARPVLPVGPDRVGVAVVADGAAAMPYLGFFWKTLLVAITLGSGFYGGIVTPQFVIGAVSGNALAHLLGISPALGSAVGLVAVVASASNTPIAAILMGVELFGGVTGTIYVSGAAMAAYIMIGHRSVYPDQLVAYPKSTWMHGGVDLPLGQEKMRLSFGMLKWISRMLAKRDHLLRRDTGSRHRAHLPGDDDRESEG